MTDDDAFLRAIQAAPNDVAPKLVYADWLDENGQPLRAEYLRTLVEPWPAEGTPERLQHFSRRIELQTLAGQAWIDLVTNQRPLAWDTATTIALARLEGFLKACEQFNNPHGHMLYLFYVNLHAKSGSAVDTIHAIHAQHNHTVNVTEVANFRADLDAHLAYWLLQRFPLSAAPEPRFAVHNFDGRGYFVGIVRQMIEEVVQPIRMWRMDDLKNPMLGSRSAAYALEGSNRILFLSFMFSD